MSGRGRSPIQRILAATAGALFLFSIAVAQVAFCQCGIFCGHDGDASARQVASEPVEAPHGCCSEEGRTEAPAPAPVEEAPDGENSGSCPCPVEISSIDDTGATGHVSAVQTSVFHDAVYARTSESVIAPDSLGDSVGAPVWRPVRGSPLPHPPLFLLNSVFTI